MNTLPTNCPICGGEITVTRIYCRDCDTTIESRFMTSPFAHLSPTQLVFVQTFIRCEGKINRMEGELGLSYPTIRNRLHEIIRAMGYEPGKDEDQSGLSEEDRQHILEELENGQISVDQAMQLLQEKGG